MKKAIGILAILAIAATAQAGPVYNLSWDFENGTVGSPYPGWSGGTVQVSNGYSGQMYPSKRLFTGDGVASWLNLPQATDSFIFTTKIRWDAGAVNGIRGAGMGYRYVGANEVWFEGVAGAWAGIPSDRLRFGDPQAVNPRPGSAGQWADYQWQGGDGRALKCSQDGVTDLGYQYATISSSWGTVPVGEAEMMIKYNTPSNPGTIELYWRSLDYDNPRAPAGTWLKLGWQGAGGVKYWDFILHSPVREINQIKLGGANAWSQCSFDDVTFQSLPEPAALLLLGLGTIPMLRRRRA